MEHVLNAHLDDRKDIHVAVGLDVGTVLVTRLGKKGERDVVCLGPQVTSAEGLQLHSSGQEIRLSKAALTKEQILLNEPDQKTNVVANWRFDETPGVLKDFAGYQPDLTRGGTKSQAPKASDNFLIDFCHVLLNANEFLYVE